MQAEFSFLSQSLEPSARDSWLLNCKITGVELCSVLGPGFGPTIWSKSKLRLWSVQLSIQASVSLLGQRFEVSRSYVCGLFSYRYRLHIHYRANDLKQIEVATVIRSDLDAGFGFSIGKTLWGISKLRLAFVQFATQASVSVIIIIITIMMTMIMIMRLLSLTF